MKTISRSLRPLLRDPQCHLSTLPPTFLLPFRAHLTTTSTSIDSTPIPESIDPVALHKQQRPSTLSSPPRPAASHQPTPPPTSPPPPTTPQRTTLTPHLRQLLPTLRSQPPHYITAHLHSRPYLLTAGDTLRLPFLMPGVVPGDVLRLNRASVIGSRDYTMQGGTTVDNTRRRYLDERLFECRAMVVGSEMEPMRVMEKTKRRQRHVKRVKSKGRFTVLRVMEVRVRGVEEIEAEVVGEGEAVEGVGEGVEVAGRV